MTKTKTTTCSRCKGQGFGTWVVDNGRCFKCLGTGRQLRLSDSDRVRVTEMMIERERTLIVKDAEAIKAEIALITRDWGSDDESLVTLNKRLDGKRRAWVEAGTLVAPRTVDYSWKRKLS